VKFRRLGWAGHVTRIGEAMNKQSILEKRTFRKGAYGERRAQQGYKIADDFREMGASCPVITFIIINDELSDSVIKCLVV
jgi:hypothetical protein